MGCAVVTLLNQKGGVGKTSTCHHLAGTLAGMGRRVLLMDNDPQASLTQGFLGPQATRALDPRDTIDACHDDLPLPARVTIAGVMPGIDLVPGSRAASRHNTPLPWAAARDLQRGLRTFVEAVRDGYDMVLIDCPPNLHLCAWAALAASDFVVVPLQPEDYGSQGIGDVRESVELVRGRINPTLSILGYLLTMVQPRRAVHRLYEERLRAEYGPLVFDARIPHAADFPEAIAHRRPVSAYKPKGAAARSIRSLADEMLARIELDRTRGEAG